MSKEISSDEIINIKNKDINNYKEITIKDNNLIFSLNQDKNIKI